jgi:hypothetical protein
LLIITRVYCPYWKCPHIHLLLFSNIHFLTFKFFVCIFQAESYGSYFFSHLTIWLFYVQILHDIYIFQWLTQLSFTDFTAQERLWSIFPSGNPLFWTAKKCCWTEPTRSPLPARKQWNCAFQILHFVSTHWLKINTK